MWSVGHLRCKKIRGTRVKHNIFFVPTWMNLRTHVWMKASSDSVWGQRIMKDSRRTCSGGWRPVNRILGGNLCKEIAGQHQNVLLHPVVVTCNLPFDWFEAAVHNQDGVQKWIRREPIWVCASVCVCACCANKQVLIFTIPVFAVCRHILMCMFQYVWPWSKWIMTKWLRCSLA